VVRHQRTAAAAGGPIKAQGTSSHAAAEPAPDPAKGAVKPVRREAGSGKK
jgi:hypothetical protein